MMREFERQPATPLDRRPWKSPVLNMVGTVGQVLQQGGGKPSVTDADPGEPRKTGPTQG